MNEFYGKQHRQWQQEHGTEALADRIKELIVLTELPEMHQAFIESRDMFFLTSIDHRGFPTCSYKGGAPGFVKVLDPQTIAFPSYDGNGMFLSLGNLSVNNKIGMLFIDFEHPHRLRLHGTAGIDKADPLLSEFPGADLVVRIAISEIFVNCPRYIHQYQRVQTSKYAPQAGNEKPDAPQWKRIDAIQDALPERDKHVAEQMGGCISPEEYGELLVKGLG